MKSINLLNIFALFLSIQLFSCASDIEEIDDDVTDQIIFNERIVYQSELTFPNFIEREDPNNDLSWTWMDKMMVKVHYLSVIDQDIDKEIGLPWYTQGNPLSVVDPDIKPQDGWAFAFKDFGTPQRRTRMPILSMYNENTQILRLFVYNSQQVGANYFKGDMVIKDKLNGHKEIFKGEARAVANSYDAWINFEFKVIEFTAPLDIDKFLIELNVSGVVETVIFKPWS